MHLSQSLLIFPAWILRLFVDGTYSTYLFNFASGGLLTDTLSQAGNLTDGCTSASTHFNPYGQTHGAPTDHVRHVGDLGNIKSDEHGHASFVQWDDVISLEGERNIVGYVFTFSHNSLRLTLHPDAPSSCTPVRMTLARAETTNR